MNKTKELRWLLSGRTTMQDGIVHVRQKGEAFPLFSGGNGAFSALFLGLMQHKCYLQVPDDADLTQDVIKALACMGTPVRLFDSPNVPACLHRNTMADQCVFTADMTEDGLLELSVFQGKSLFGILNMTFLMRRLLSGFPDTYTRAVVPKQSRKERQMEKRQKRLDKRLNKHTVKRSENGQNHSQSTKAE